jgi:hypothetical protein
MILSTHAIAGAAIASFLPSHPAAAFVLGFASHFALDAIPHWDYPIRSASVNPKINAPVTFDRTLLRDAVTIGADGSFGILAALVLFASPEGLWAVLSGAFGAMLPDPLQFVHARFRHEPLETLQRFHRWIHTDMVIKEHVVLGVGSQLLLVALIVGLTAAAHAGFFSPAFAFATTPQAP